MPSKYVGDALPGCKRCPLRNFLKGVIYTWCQYFRSKHTFIGKLPFFLVLSEYPDARNPFWISTRKGFMILPGALAAIFRRASHPHEGISCRSRWEGIKWQHPVDNVWNEVIQGRDLYFFMLCDYSRTVASIDSKFDMHVLLVYSQNLLLFGFCQVKIFYLPTCKKKFFFNFFFSFLVFHT